jgi:hypothetical protein
MLLIGFKLSIKFCVDPVSHPQGLAVEQLPDRQSIDGSPAFAGAVAVQSL